MNTHYLVEQGEVLARGTRAELAPFATESRLVVFAPDWVLGITWIQDPRGEVLDLLCATFGEDEPIVGAALLAWHETLDRLGVAH